MRYTLYCCNCKQTFLFDFSKSEAMPDACPRCHERFIQHEFSKVNDFMDKMDRYNSGFASLKIKRAFEPMEGELLDIATDNNVFSSDIRQIIRFYENAKGEHRKLLTNIIDKLYLLLNRDVRSGCVDFSSSQRLFDLLKQEFEESIEERNNNIF